MRDWRAAVRDWSACPPQEMKKQAMLRRARAPIPDGLSDSVLTLSDLICFTNVSVPGGNRTHI